MDMELKDKFIELWKKYFNNAELPITFYYTDEEGHAEFVKPGSVARCIIGALSNVRKGKSLCFNIESVGCFGGKRYLGFSEKIRPNFEFFLSCGIPGELEGERYKKSPELVKELMKNVPVFKAPSQFIVFKRWDMLENDDNPEVVIFFSKPDVLSGIFTLAGFDVGEPNGVISPFGSGCGTIVQYPYLEKDSENPRGVLGMFDVSARPYVHADELTLAVPMTKFVTMVENMEESFLTTGSWKMVQKRIR
ncbi:MAG: DUF169 domain-containing protein [Candidatus Methanoperedens sp.]|nr:DUF169 domain-containing protein [Candidatus Methanoperedens sp.]MCZ7371620.1 DUF169 domain-containing protein [Candidatus Methanoperedens sp.]